MFINRGNHNNLLHYSNLTDNVAFKIIKYILLVTSLILLLIYVVLYVVFMLFAAKFIEQFQTEAKQLQRENIVAEAKLVVSVAFIGVLCLQAALIYAIYRELYRVINLFAIFSLLIALSVLWSQGVFFSFGHFMIALLHSVLLFYYAYRIRRLRMANVLYIANGSAPDGLMYSNYGAPPLPFNHMKPFRSRLFGSNRANHHLAAQQYSYPSSYYGGKLDPNLQAHAYPSHAGLVDPAGYVTGSGSMYPVQAVNAAVGGPPLPGQPHLQPQPTYVPSGYQSNSIQPSSQAAAYHQLNGNLQPAYAHSNAYPTVLNQGSAATSGYQHVTANAPINAMDRYNVYGNRTVSRQTPQIPSTMPYQRGYYDSSGYASNAVALNATQQQQQRSWNVNVNPVTDYAQPPTLMSSSGAMATTATRTNDPIYMSRADANAMYQSNANNFVSVARRPNAYAR
jgi:hypothetical protein